MEKSQAGGGDGHHPLYVLWRLAMMFGISALALKHLKEERSSWFGNLHDDDKKGKEVENKQEGKTDCLDVLASSLLDLPFSRIFNGKWDKGIFKHHILQIFICYLAKKGFYRKNGRLWPWVNVCAQVELYGLFAVVARMGEFGGPLCRNTHRAALLFLAFFRIPVWLTSIRHAAVWDEDSSSSSKGDDDEEDEGRWKKIMKYGTIATLIALIAQDRSWMGYHWYQLSKMKRFQG